MGIKRPLLILGSTVSAVAAVLSYHPAASGTSALLSPTDTPTETPLPTQTPTPIDSSTPAQTSTPTPAESSTPDASSTPTSKSTPTPKASKSSSAKKSSGSGSSANATTTQSGDSGAAANTSTADNSPAPKASAEPAPTPSSKVAKDQTVTGATAQTRWGPVQVQITVKDGKIVDAVGLQYPNGDRRSLWISEQAIPWLVEETLAEQIADVQIIGGATYTTMGWRQSLASAMQKAGL